MALKSSNIRVPIGAGVDRTDHEFTTETPKAHVLQNLSTERGKAYRKRDGSSDSGLTITGESAIMLAPADGSLITLNETQGARYTADGQKYQSFGAQHPVTVKRHPIASIRGAVQHENIAYHPNGYTAVTAMVAENYANITFPNQINQEALQAFCVILDSDFRVVWGPYYVDELQYFPRVEVCEDGFIFTGLAHDAESTSLGDEAGRHGVGYAEMFLYAFYAEASYTTAPVPTSIVRIDTPALGSSTLEETVIYDTYGGWDGADRIVLGYYQDASGLLTLATLDKSLTLSEASAASTGVARDDMTVAYEPDSDTLLIYGAETARLYYTDLAISGALSNLAHPTSPLGEHPVLHWRGSGLLYLNDRRVTFTGSGPGTPVFQGSDSTEKVLHRKPTYGTGGVYHFSRYLETADNYSLVFEGPGATGTAHVATGRRVRGGEEIWRYDYLASPGGGGSIYPRPIAYLNSTRSPQWYNDHFMGRTTGGQHGTVGTIGQSVTRGDRLLVPQSIFGPGSLPSAHIREDQATSGFVGTSADMGLANVILYPGQITNGILDGTQSEHPFDSTYLLCVEEVILEDAVATNVPFRGTEMIAAGIVGAHDGRFSAEAILKPPVNAYIEKGFAGTAADLQTYIGPPTSGYIQLNSTGDSMAFFGVFTYTDANGIRYKSPPFNLGALEKEAADPSTVIIKNERVNFELHPSHYVPYYQGSGISLEFYATAEFNSGDPIPEYYLATRVPVQKDSDGFFADVSGIIGVDAAVPLYTASGEVEPRTPPAMNAITQAGSYLFGLSSEDPQEIWHTEPLTQGVAPTWSPLFRVQAPADGGDVVSLAGEADRLVVLSQTGVYEMFVGSGGPDITNSGSFPVFRRALRGEGCVNPAGTQSGPFGTLYLSESGPKILEPGGGIRDMGPVLDGLLDPNDIVGSAVVAARQEVWLFGSSGSYVYRWADDQWSTSTIVTDAAVSWQGQLLYKVSNQLWHVDTSEAELEGVAQIAQYVSPWLALDSETSYHRLRKVGVLLRVLSGGTYGGLRIKIEYDYVPTVIDTFTYTAAQLVALERNQLLTVRPSRQKASSYRITVEDYSDTVQQGQEGTVEKNDLKWELAGLTLTAGTKVGQIKLQAAAKR